MAWAGGKLGKAECLELAADRRLVERDTEFLKQPLSKVLAAPAHNAMDGGDRTVRHNLTQRLPLRVVELRSRAGCLAVDQAKRTAFVEAHHPIANDLHCHPTDFGCIAPGGTVIDRGQSQKSANLHCVPGLLRKPPQRRSVIVLS
jgi:hypothetical protein